MAIGALLLDTGAFEQRKKLTALAAGRYGHPGLPDTSRTNETGTDEL